jgi:hypothetical protein
MQLACDMQYEVECLMMGLAITDGSSAIHNN